MYRKQGNKFRIIIPDRDCSSTYLNKVPVSEFKSRGGGRFDNDALVDHHDVPSGERSNAQLLCQLLRSLPRHDLAGFHIVLKGRESGSQAHWSHKGDKGDDRA